MADKSGDELVNRPRYLWRRLGQEFSDYILSALRLRPMLRCHQRPVFSKRPPFNSKLVPAANPISHLKRGLFLLSCPVHLPSIFAMMKMSAAPPNPPPHIANYIDMYTVCGRHGG